MDYVDLTASDHQSSPREYLVARDIMEPLNCDSAEPRVRVARDSSRDDAGNDKIDDSNEDNDSDHDSEASDLPSLQDIFAQADREFRKSSDLSDRVSTSEVPINSPRKERCSECDREDRANPAATTATSVQPGASQGE